MSQVKSLSEKLMNPHSQSYKDAYRVLELLERLWESVLMDSDDDMGVQAALEIVLGSMQQFVDTYVFGEEDI